MGLRFRRSFNLGGGFRVNLSKSGVSYSWGVPGYRVTKTSSGKTRRTYSIPGTGISYVDEGSGNNSQTVPRPDDVSTIDWEDIDGNNLSDLQPVEFEDFIKKLTLRIHLRKWSTRMVYCFILFFNPLFVTIGVVGLLIKLYMMTFGKLQIDYTLDDDSLEQYNNRVDAWKLLKKSKQLWYIDKTATVNTKNYGGSSLAASMKPLKISTKKPYFMKTNMDIIQLSFKKGALIILPDRIVLMDSKNVGVAKHENISYEVEACRTVQHEKAPSDARKYGTTWEHVNKDGTPDARYKNNKAVDVYLYPVIRITSSEGLNVSLSCSSYAIGTRFEKAFS